MNNNILILGIKTQAFLKATAMGLKKCGFHVKLEKSDIAQHFKLMADNYFDIQKSFNCQCFEMSHSPSELEIESITSAIRGSKHIIIVIPIKLFQGWRYNADDNLSSISNWITPNRLQNIIHGAIDNDEVLLSWAITETDKVSDLFLNTHHRDSITAVTNAENIDDFLLMSDEAINSFFVESEEKEFLAHCKNHESVSFAFLPEQKSCFIGEKASALWNVSIFLGTAIGHLPSNLFTQL